jgi:protein arginine N-methyltransferase 2
MDVEWTDVEVPIEGMEQAGEGEWTGVRRRYWTLDKYRLPICTFLG